MWKAPRIWNGGEAWIMGGGSSVMRQFNIPEQVCKQVLAGASPSLYSPYLSALHNKHVIGVNAAYLIGNWIDVIFFGDFSFFLKHQQPLFNYPNLVVSCAIHMEQYAQIKFLPKDGNHSRGLTTNPMKVSWNQSSGGAAISLAVHTGVKRIYLLGFDMTWDEKDNSHWHGVYTRRGRDSKKTIPFYRHLEPFVQIARDARKLGVEIINCNPDSRINEFPKCNVQEVLK